MWRPSFLSACAAKGLCKQCQEAPGRWHKQHYRGMAVHMCGTGPLQQQSSGHSQLLSLTCMTPASCCTQGVHSVGRLIACPLPAAALQVLALLGTEDYGPANWLWQAALPTKQGHLVWEFEALPPVDNLSASCHGVIGVEGRVPHHHLVHDGSHRPPVALHAITLLQQHLRRNVVWGAHGRVGLQQYSSSSSGAVQPRWRTAVKAAAALGSCSCEHAAHCNMQQGNGSLAGTADAHQQQPARSTSGLLMPQPLTSVRLLVCHWWRRSASLAWEGDPACCWLQGRCRLRPSALCTLQAGR